MNQETAGKLIEADLSRFAAVASRLDDRMRTAATTYLGICISACTGLVAIFNLAPKNGADVIDVYLANRAFVGVAGACLYALGFLRVLAFCRDRKHYIKLMNLFNDVRARACAALEIEGRYRTTWDNTLVETWPPDSVTTFTLLTLTASSTLVLLITLHAFSLTAMAIASIAILCLLAQLLLALTVSK